MALRDWKKVRIKPLMYKNKKGNKLVISKYKYNYGNIYEVYLIIGHLATTLKNNLDKSQALKFAKSYMRSH